MSVVFFHAYCTSARFLFSQFWSDIAAAATATTTAAADCRRRRRRRRRPDAAREEEEEVDDDETQPKEQKSFFQFHRSRVIAEGSRRFFLFLL